MRRLPFSVEHDSPLRVSWTGSDGKIRLSLGCILCLTLALASCEAFAQTDSPPSPAPRPTAPESATPESATPGTAAPEAPTPGTPGTGTPGTGTPGTDTPGTDTPGTDTPGTDTPGTDTPGTGAPGTGTASPAPEDPPASAGPAERVAPIEPPGPSQTDLETRIQLVASSVDLNETQKTQITDLLKKAIARLDESQLAKQRIDLLTQQSLTAAADIQSVQSRLEKLVARQADDPQALSKVSLEQLQPLHRQAVADLAVLDQQLKTLNEQVELWGKRIAELPALIATSRSALVDAEQQLSEIGAGQSDPILGARRTLLQIRTKQLRDELALFALETQVSEDAQRLLALQRDASAREQVLQQKQVENLQSALAKAEQAEAMQKANQAVQAVQKADQELKDAVEFNLALANKKTTLLEQLENDRKAIVVAREEYLARNEQFTETRKQAEAAQFSEEIGLLLRNEKNELPSTSTHYQESQKRRTEIGELTVLILKWENERRKLLDLDSAVAQYIDNHAGLIPEDDRESVEDQLRRVFNDRLTLYRELTEIARKRLSRLSNLEVEQRRLTDLIDEHAAFVSEHVLWVPSTPPIWNFSGIAWSEPFRESFRLQTWIAGVQVLLGDLRRNPFASVPVWLLIGWLLMTRGRIKQKIARLGQEASRPNATQLTPTATAVLMTILLAAPGALVVWWIAWRLENATSIGTPLHTFGETLFRGGVLMYAIDFARHVFRTDGIAEDHFDWDVTATQMIRRGLVWSARIIVPCAVVVLYTERRGDEWITTSLGRLAFSIAMLTAAVILWRWLGPRSTIMPQVRAASETWSAGVGWALVPLVTFVPVVLMAGSLAGYHYAAVQLCWRFGVSVALVSMLIFVRALLMRWLLITYRRVAIARARERREALALVKEATPEMPVDAAVIIESAGHVQLSDLNRQAQRFVRLLPILLGAIGLYLTWSEFFPALGVVNRYPLWLNVLHSTNSDTGPVWVTLGDLIMAIVSVVLTVIACRNVPGLMDITLLQRLPLDAGARYAASAMSRYVMIVIGVLATFKFLGVSWSSVQWLVAAMTVGLGFGLQEIFANFVSGIILLFERPARVGDTVTIGDVTGTVTRIRIRATTILDWDNKELVVPNKEFVTGNLVNWTLSNASLRLVTSIGVAYGSDTRLTTKLLYEVAEKNASVLEDPAPMVIFNEFGESTLQFELRVFVGGVMSYRRLKHELHLAIDDAFHAHNIEIAFPQRDLHVRSVEGLDAASLLGKLD
ncbi:mechanosensitive ion channel domain-containing protein [Novipirellula galeiformis]|uniref:mechanosensitive ion channel domain-containing protein n=1 Tax=Novipirellula galeiformis TaxID=2528004 RepID=UPI0011B5B99E|nr:mechanosensitive ion channel domain-containing protein [Novipirellula galeiformis]